MTPSELVGRVVYFGRRQAKVVAATDDMVRVVFAGECAEGSIPEWRSISELSEVEVPMVVKYSHRWCLWLDPDVPIRNEEGKVVDRGARFFVRTLDGEDHLVAEWRGDGISTDSLWCEEPALVYGVTTTPHQRCIRMALEELHWVLTSALLVGPGDGELASLADCVESGDAVLPTRRDDDS